MHHADTTSWRRRRACYRDDRRDRPGRVFGDYRAGSVSRRVDRPGRRLRRRRECGASPAAGSGLEGTLWRLTEYQALDGNAVPVPQAISASATFAAGTVSGNAGCNDYTGGYTVDGDKLTIGPLAATKKACGPAETAVETAFLAAMGKVATYAVTGGSLELTDDREARSG